MVRVKRAAVTVIMLAAMVAVFVVDDHPGHDILGGVTAMWQPVGTLFAVSIPLLDHVGWLYVAPLLGAPFLIAIVEALLRRRRETRVLARPIPATARRGDADMLLVPSAIALVATTVVFVVPNRPVILALVVALLLAVTVLLVRIASHLQRIPNHDRRFKYAVVLVAVLLCWLAGAVAGRRVANDRVLPMTNQEALTTVLPLAWYLATAWIVRGIMGQLDGKNLRLLRWFGVSWANPLFLISLIVFSGPIVVTVLLIRFYSGAYLRSRPIVYLRSFSYADAPRVFARIVAPAAAVHGVVVALVHARQTASDLQAKIPMALQAEVQAVPDEAWQTWVEAQLRSASAVILDCSVVTESVTWEFAAASAALERRLILLEREGTATRIAPGAVVRYKGMSTRIAPGAVVRYGDDTRAQRIARDALDEALERAVDDAA